jgi:small subunit ribosomal protein S6
VNPVPKYELIFVMRVDTPAAEIEARADKAAALMAEHHGEIKERNHWGARRLAYQIDHQTQGDYTFFRFRADGTVVADLDRLFRQDDQCLRHLIVVDEEWRERNSASQAKARASAAQASARLAARPAASDDEE